MELFINLNENEIIIVLLDDKMRIVKPVYDFLRYLKARDMAINTLKACGRDLKIYWEFLCEYNYIYNEVTPDTISDFIEYLRKGNKNIYVLYKKSIRTAKTINRILNTVYQLYKYLGTMNMINNPIIMKDINRPFNMFKSLLHHARNNNQTKQSIFKIKESKHSVRLVTNLEAEIFMNALPTLRDKLLFKILYLTGARIQEALDLKIESIPIPDSSKPLEVLKQIKSKGKFRDLYVSMPLIIELDSYILEERTNIDTSHSFIFVSQQPQFLGKKLTYRGVYEVFKTVKKKTNIDFNFHDLRHTFISHLVESGLDISVVRIIAGHEYITTTQQYTHLSNPYIKDCLSKYWEKSLLIGGILNGK